MKQPTRVRFESHAPYGALLAATLLAACGGAAESDGAAVVPEATTPAEHAAHEPPVPTLAVSAADAAPVESVGAPPLSMTVHKSPTCGCCAAWIDYMGEEGFATHTVETDALDAIKAELGLTDPALTSCHTAVVGGYVIEGHVPADDVRRLLEERPDIVGLTAPGMPAMSPGMGSREPEGYDVLAFDEDGGTRLWSSY